MLSEHTLSNQFGETTPIRQGIVIPSRRNSRRNLVDSTDHFALTHITCIENGQFAEDYAIVIQAGKITYAGPHANRPSLEGHTVFDGSGKSWIIAPGFIDLQFNGGYGEDFTANPHSITSVAARLPETGVIAFLPTFITSPLEDYAEKLEATLQAEKPHHKTALKTTPGSLVLGAHIEGPFLNPDSRGAHNASLFHNPTPQALEYLDPRQAIRLLTLATERPGGLDAVRTLVDAGIVVSIGHSQATYDEAQAAFEAGVSYATHLFNAMPPPHHREPGLIGALLTQSALRCGLIVDGIHVHPAMIKLAYQCLGIGGITLVTDAMAAMGMPPGTYNIGDQRVIVDKTSARLENGTLAGSILRMDQAIRNMIQFSGCSLAEAVRMASTTPAEVLGLQDRFGHILSGYPANLVLLEASGQVQATWINGQLAYHAANIFKPPY
jgi:N-acetylglucosamine-6-phosphate deacetylase